MSTLKIIFGGLAFSLLFSVSADAKLFRNAYVQFVLPSAWNCKLEGTEWVCNSRKKNDKTESIIILTAKEIGPKDNFAAYMKHLQTPRVLPGAKGKSVTAKIKQKPRKRGINGHQWIDSLHLGSEIPGYYTRYLATVKDRLAILVTLSAHQRYYTKYSSDFFKAVESLRVVAAKNLLGKNGLAPIRPGGRQNIGQPIAQFPDEMGPPGGTPVPSGGTHKKVNMMLGGLGLVILALAYYYWKNG